MLVNFLQYSNKSQHGQSVTAESVQLTFNTRNDIERCHHGHGSSFQKIFGPCTFCTYSICVK